MIFNFKKKENIDTFGMYLYEYLSNKKDRMRI